MGADTRPGGELTALVARVIAWADGRRLGRGAGTNVTAHGLGLSSGQSGERGGDRKQKGDHRLPPHEAARGIFITKESDLRYDI